MVSRIKKQQKAESVFRCNVIKSHHCNYRFHTSARTDGMTCSVIISSQDERKFLLLEIETSQQDERKTETQNQEDETK